MGLFRASLDYEPEGEYVTASRVRKMGDVLEEGEKVMYLIRGTAVDVEGTEGGEVAPEAGRTREASFRRWIRAGITDRRVVLRIPRRFGNDEWSIPYDRLTDVNLSISSRRTEFDTSFERKRLTLRSPESTYRIEVDEPGKSECRDAVRFLREKTTDGDEQQVDSKNPDPGP